MKKARQRVRKVVMPAYLTGFSCLGSACEDSCCIAAWKVPVDKVSYDRFQTVADPEWRPLLQAHVELEPNSPLPEQHARIKFGADSSCPFLTADRLCAMQQRFGSAMLSNVCACYPQVTNVVDGSQQRTGLMSCPEIVRLALFDPEAMVLISCQEPVTTRMVPTYEQTSSRLAPGDPRTHFLSIRKHVVALLQDADLPLRQRLMALGHALGQLTELGRDGSVQVQSVTEAFASGRRVPIAMASFGLAELDMLRQLTAEGVSMGVRPRFLSVVERTAQALHLAAVVPAGADALDRYLAGLSGQFGTYVAGRPYLMQNLVVNQVYASSFPFVQGRSMFDEFVLFVLRSALVRLYLIGTAVFEGGLTDELAVEVVQSFHRSFDQSPQFMASILVTAAARGVDNVAALGGYVGD